MTCAQPVYPSLRRVVLTATGQDVRNCCNCALCSETVGNDDLALLVQRVIVNDERALGWCLVWSQPELQRAQRYCSSRLNFQAMITALRAEAQRRGLAFGGNENGG